LTYETPESRQLTNGAIRNSGNVIKIFPPAEIPTLFGGLNIIFTSVDYPVMEEFSLSISMLGRGRPTSFGVKKIPVEVDM